MTIIIFFILLSVLVLFHELGHYLAARLFGVKALEFGFGFPPRAIGLVKDRGRWKWVGPRDQTEYKKTVWSLNWLPFGGFVRLKGEVEDGDEDRDSLVQKPFWQKLVVMSAGVGLNWVLAVALFFTVFTFGTTAVLEDLPSSAKISNRAIMVVQVLPGSPADKAGVQSGDEIVSLAGSVPVSEQAARDAIGAQGEKSFEMVVKRNEQDVKLELKPIVIKEINKPGIGVGLANVGFVTFPVHVAAYQSVYMTAVLTKAVVVAFGNIFKDLIVTHKVNQDLAGPIGIAVMTGQVARQGLMPLLQFAAMLSINLAVINFLPIPALDGGRALFLLIEKIRRRPMGRKLEVGIHNVAFLLLILLIVLVTARDLFRYGGMILGSVKGLVGM